MQKLSKFHKLVSIKIPAYLAKLFPKPLSTERDTRAANNHTFTLIKPNTTYVSNPFQIV